jgi:uncharacterized protein YdeI (YjbR/CyaY-like superfamily)
LIFNKYQNSDKFRKLATNGPLVDKMRKIKLDSVTEHTPQIFRVLSLDNLDVEWFANQSILVPITNVQEIEIFDRYIQAGLDNLYSIYSSDLLERVGANNLFIPEQQVLESNDVVNIDPYKRI